MSKKRRSNRVPPGKRNIRSHKERRQPWRVQALCVAVLALLAVLHLASVVVEFRRVAGLHRWLMTYAEGFHRRGLVGTIFQFLVGHLPLEAQIELASRMSEAGTYLWLLGALALFVVAAVRVRDRALGWAALGFAAFAFINPMWTTRAFDNGYPDWLVGIAVVAALAAFAGRKPLLSGALVAAGIVAYWGTIFVWLPLGFLIVCLLLRDATAHREGNVPHIQGIIASFRRREVAALLLPAAAALLSAHPEHPVRGAARAAARGGQTEFTATVTPPPELEGNPFVEGAGDAVRSTLQLVRACAFCAAYPSRRYGSAAVTGRSATVRGAPYAALTAGVLAVAAYLCLVNLDYAALWHDEAPTALIGRNLLQRGDITGWDGRNLVGGTNGRTLNEDLRDVLPPLMYVLNAAGMAVFGVNETGARIMPALIGILSLGLLYLLLRQHLADHPRLIFFSLLLAAWSPQLLLYFRQSRYYAFMACGVIAAFYLYECWWRSGKTGYLGALALVAALAFFNHYIGGAATMLALAAWHLLFRTRETGAAAMAGAGRRRVRGGGLGHGVSLLGGGDRRGAQRLSRVLGRYRPRSEYRGTTPLLLLRIGIYTRDLFTPPIWSSWPATRSAGRSSIPVRACSIVHPGFLRRGGSATV